MRAHLLVFCIAAGCGGDDGATGFTEEQAKSLGLEIALEISYGTAMFAPANVDAAGECGTTTGDLADPDGDSIPANGGYSFDCPTISDFINGSMRGTRTYVDDRPAEAAWAFTSTLTERTSYTTASGGGATRTREWTTRDVATHDRSVIALAHTTDSTSIGTSQSRNDAFAMHIAWTFGYSPFGVFEPGAPPAGAVDITGSLDADIDGTEVAGAMVTTTLPFLLDKDCATLVAKGAVQTVFVLDDITYTVGVAIECNKQPATSLSFTR